MMMPSTAATLLATGPELDRGLPNPGRDSQAIFRIILDSMANPGRIAALPTLVKAQDGLGSSAAAICLALADHETPLWLDPSLASPAASTFLRFHTGAPIAPAPDVADFVVLQGASTPLNLFKTGSDAYPEGGATVIIQVRGLSPHGPLTLLGPGIDGQRRLGVDGLAASFWNERAAVNNGFPRGIDLIFCAGEQITALPRTTRIVLPGEKETK
jgi:alpha-D-ribose 1-methylphosphonate 5-triphosphate synthase subunit PhnH